MLCCWNRLLLKIQFLLLSFFISTCVVSIGYCSNNSEDTQQYSELYKELLETKVVAFKESNEKDLQTLIVRLESQDKRIGDVGLYLTAFGVVLALLALVGGWFGVITVKSRAREEARDVANQWFQDKQQELDQQAKQLSLKIDNIQKQLSQQTVDFDNLQNSLQNKLTQDASKHYETMQDSAIAAQEVIAKVQRETLQRLTKHESDLLARAAEITRHKPESEYTISDWITRAYDADQKGQKEEAITYWRKLLGIKNITDTQYSEALFNIAIALEGLNRHQEAVTEYDILLAKYNNSSNEKLNIICAMSIANQGLIQGDKFDDSKRAIETYKNLINYYGKSSIPEIQHVSAKALVHQSNLYKDKLKDTESEIKSYDTLLELFGELSNNTISVICVNALHKKAESLNRANNMKGAINTYDYLLDKYKKSDTPEIQEDCAKALVNKGRILGIQLKKQRNAIEAYDKAFSTYAGSNNPKAQSWAAKALYNKASLLGNRDDGFKQELSTYDELLARFGDSSNPEVHLWCARAIFFKAQIFTKEMKKYHKGITLYDNLLFRYGSFPAPKIQLECAEALMNKAWIMAHKLDDPRGAISVYDNLFSLFGKSSNTDLRVACATALANKGHILEDKCKDYQSAIAIYDSLLSQLGGSINPSLQAQCAKALFFKGQSLAQLGDSNGEVSAYNKLLESYREINHSGVQVQVLNASIHSVIPLIVQKKKEEAMSRIWETLDHIDSTKQQSAIMVFLLWLVDESTNIEDVLAAINLLPPETTFDWDFEKLQPYIDSISKKYRQQTFCFINYFRNDSRIMHLNNCLNII